MHQPESPAWTHIGILQPMPDNPVPPDNKRCVARVKGTDRRCRKRRAYGSTVCRSHGAAGSPRVGAERRQREQQIREAAATYGLPIEISPHDALVQEIHRTAGHVAWLYEIVKALDPEQVTKGVTKTVRLPDLITKDGVTAGGVRTEAAAAVSVWVQLYQHERDHLRKVCTDAIRAGVEERRVRLEEEKAVRLAGVVRHIVTDLGHDLADDRVRKIVRDRLMEATA
jgi:hypothetical protein